MLQLREKTALAKASAVSTAPIKERTPLIKRVSGPDEPPRYEPTGGPRPLETLPRGVRKPPTLNDTFGVPFLRFYKPQPRFLERVVRQRSRRRQKRIHALFDIQTGDMELARWEDEWEWLVGQLQKRGKVPGFKPFEDRTARADGKEWRPAWLRYGQDRSGERSYEQALWDAVVYLSDVTNREREDMAARGRAMWRIVLAEREQALEEKKRWLSEHGMGHLPPKPTVWRRPVWASKTSWKRKGAWVRRRRALWKRKHGKSQDGRESEGPPETTGGQEKAGSADGTGAGAGRMETTGTGNGIDRQRIGVTPEEQTEVEDTSAVVNRSAREKLVMVTPNLKGSKKVREEETITSAFPSRATQHKRFKDTTNRTTNSKKP